MFLSSRAGRISEAVEKIRWALYRQHDRLVGGSPTEGMVSVLIPALETRAELLDRRSLPSIDRQTYPLFEVIVVSEVFSQEIADAVARRGRKYLYFWGTSKSRALLKAGSLAMWCSGAAPNLNLALKKGQGEFFARMDDDDEWLPHHLENAVQVINRESADFVSSQAFAPDGSLVEENDLAGEAFSEEFKRHAFVGTVGTTITWLYRRHLRAYRFNSRSWKKKINRPVDYDFMLRIASGGARMVFSPKVTAQQGLRPGVGELTGHRAYEAEITQEKSL